LEVKASIIDSSSHPYNRRATADLHGDTPVYLALPVVNCVTVH
jgi:hypothetical protein